MPEITENNDIVTQITTVKVPPDNQSEVLELMTESRTRFDKRLAALGPDILAEELD